NKLQLARITKANLILSTIPSRLPGDATSFQLQPNSKPSSTTTTNKPNTHLLALKDHQTSPQPHLHHQFQPRITHSIYPRCPTPPQLRKRPRLKRPFPLSPLSPKSSIPSRITMLQQTS